MLVVGSKALKYRFPRLSREVKDVDIIAYESEVSDLQLQLCPTKITKTPELITFYSIQNRNEIFDKANVEILIADKSDSLKMYLIYQKLTLGDDLFAASEILYSLKKSHINFPVKFEKHIEDYTFLNAFFSGIDKLSKVTKINFKETESRLGRLKTPSLNKSVDQFFDQSKSFVKSYFVHDHIHQAVSHYEQPLYLGMQKDTNMAKCDKDLWNQFTFEDKCKCVLEEAYVIALERKILPVIYGDSKQWFSADEALRWSLKRICTTLTSGWFRQFATDNYHYILKMYNENYVTDFLDKVDKRSILRGVV